MAIKNEVDIFLETLQTVSGMDELGMLVSGSIFEPTWDGYTDVLSDFEEIKSAYEQLGIDSLSGKLTTDLDRKRPIIDVNFTGPEGVNSSLTVYYTVNIIDFPGSTAVGDLVSISILAKKLLPDTDAYFRLYDLTNKQTVVECEIDSTDPVCKDLGAPIYLPKHRVVLECQLKVENMNNKAMLYSIVGK